MKSKVSLTVISYLLIFFLSPACASPRPNSYWLHTSCDAYPQVQRAVVEAIDMAKVADEQLKPEIIKEKRAYSNWLFKVIYKLDPEDPAAAKSLDFVRAIFTGKWFQDDKNENQFQFGIKAMQLASARTLATIRIYCDEDSGILGQPGGRWTKVPSDDGDDDPNEHREPDAVEWEDKDNQIRLSLDNGKTHRGCTSNDLLAHTDVGSVSVPNQVEPRAVITICNLALEEGNWQTLDQSFDRTANYGNQPFMDQFDSLLSLVILHEFTHVLPWETRDIRGEDSYGWQVISSMLWSEAIFNADSYAFYGALLLLATKFKWEVAKIGDAYYQGHIVYTGPMAPATTPQAKPRKERSMGCTTNDTISEYAGRHCLDFEA